MRERTEVFDWACWVTQYRTTVRILLVCLKLAARTPVALYSRKKNLICLAHGGCEGFVRQNRHSQYTMYKVQFDRLRTRSRIKIHAQQRQGTRSVMRDPFNEAILGIRGNSRLNPQHPQMAGNIWTQLTIWRRTKPVSGRVAYQSLCSAS